MWHFSEDPKVEIKNQNVYCFRSVLLWSKCFALGSCVNLSESSNLLGTPLLA